MQSFIPRVVYFVCKIYGLNIMGLLISCASACRHCAVLYITDRSTGFSQICVCLYSVRIFVSIL